MAKTYQETRVRVGVTFADGTKEVNVWEESDAQERLKELQADPKVTDASVQAAQTFTFYEVSDEDPLGDFTTLVPSSAEQSNIVNRAIVLKQQQWVRKTMLNETFVAVDGSYDLAEVCGAVTERQKASPEQKAASALSKLLGRNITVDQLNDIVASLGVGSSAATA